ncbi:hypothetical protein CDL12_15172 [Handroanthus impetiginosus]|uniref:Uncharacterized protein n=1 Tax=Handroanthus impetiginosus TaxID=429701 RepID=A0A2G9H3Z0_9LAMI|nr:hypothetical protein CDL12_15172 [Handroanthus impetiginosus]
MDNLDQRQQLTDQNQQQQQPGLGVVPGSGPMSYPYPAPMVATGTPAGTVSSPTQPPTSFAPQQQLAYSQAQHLPWPQSHIQHPSQQPPPQQQPSDS